MRYQKKQWCVILGTTILMMADALVHNSAGYFVAPVTEELGISRFTYMAYYTILQMVGILIIPLFSRLLTRVRAKHILLVCAVWGASGFLGFSFCTAPWMFYVVAVWQGIAVAGCTFLIAVNILESWFWEQSGIPLGITMTGTGIGGVLLGMFLPRAVSAFRWTGGYQALAVCFAVMLVLAAFLTDGVPPRPELRREGVERPAPARCPWTAALVVFMLVVFVLAVQGIFLQHMQAHFVQQGMTATRAGIYMSVFSGALILFKLLLGAMIDRFGVTVTTCTVLPAFALGFLALLTKDQAWLLASVVLLAFGMASITILLPVCTRYLFGWEQFAIMYGRVMMAHNVGAACGSPLWGAIYDHTGSYTVGLWGAAVLLLLDLTVMLCLLRKRRTIS